LTEAPLGRFERVDLRSVWTSESSDFTPWLSKPENLSVLSDTLGIELELEARERAVGRFSADLLCKEVGVDRWVLIENQLERTDHTHLGQLLTYSAGLQAVTIVWIAASFTDEHRAALDWLNQITDETVRFFGLEVELWRIGASPAAPKFNIVAKPNDWSRSVAHAARSLDDSEPSGTQQLQQKYWGALNTVLNNKRGPVTGHRKPQLQSWMTYSIGRSNFHLAAAMVLTKRAVRAELYMSGPLAKAHFGLLQAQKESIESELGFALLWDELSTGNDSRILRVLDNVEPDNETQWPRQHEWLADTLNSMHRVFSRRVRELDAEQWQAEVKS
jgi:hypothetical protein